MSSLAVACLVIGILANAGLMWTAKWNDLRGGDASAFTFALFALATVITVAWAVGAGSVAAGLANPLAIGLGLLVGVLSAVEFVCFVSALHYGHTGLSATVASGGIAIPVIVGLFGLREAPSVLEMVALILMLLSFAVVLGYRYYQERRQGQAQLGRQWVVRILAAALFSGALMVCIGLWSRWTPEIPVSFMNACFYVAGTVVMGLVLLARRSGVSGGCWRRGVLAAIASAIGMMALAMGMGAPGAFVSLFAPAVVTGYTFLGMLGAELVLKEHAAPLEWLSACLGMAGVFILSVAGG